MKNKGRFLIILWSVFLIFLLIGGGIVSAKMNSLNKYSNMDEQKIIEKISGMSLDELLEEINDLAKVKDQNILIPFVSELYNRTDQIPDNQLLSALEMENFDLMTKEALIDLYFHKYENQPISPELRSLLTRKDIDSLIKEKIVSAAIFTTQDTALLKELFYDENDLLSFYSLKALSDIDAEIAYELSKQLLKTPSKTSEHRLNAALKATSHFLQQLDSSGKTFKELERDFLRIAFDIMESTESIYLHDSAFFALSELGSREAIFKIIESENIDRELKVFAIDQNYKTIESLLNNHPSETDIKLVLKAMEICPITNIIEPLTDLYNQVTDKKILNGIEKVIEFVKLEGIEANEKW